jgi:hypothetical protein
MGEPAITVVSDSKGIGDLSNDELEKILDAVLPDGSIPPAEPAPSTPEPETPPAEPEPAAEPESTPEPEPEQDIEAQAAALAAEGERIRNEKLQADLEFQRAHASRLAGEIGYLKEQIKSIQRPSEPYEPQSEAELDRLSQLEARLERSESERLRTEVAQAVESAINALDSPSIADIDSQLADVIPKYRGEFEAAQAMQDPNMARQMATAVGRSIIAEAMELKWQQDHAKFAEMKAASTAGNAKAKKAAAPSASGAVPPPAAKPRTVADWSPAELDAWMKENLR